MSNKKSLQTNPKMIWEERLFAINKQMEIDFALLRNKYEKTLTETRTMIKANNDIFNKFYKFASSHEKYLNEIARKMIDIEETIDNVFLAIRQNEFLQAHYPAQHGYADMKIIGKHPAKLKEIKP